MCAAADRLMDAHHPELFYQHDSPTGRYEDLDFGSGWLGPSRRYRKLERLERVPEFSAWIENALFERLARAALGHDVRLYRAVLWNKAAAGGHGRALASGSTAGSGDSTRAPSFQVWTALDDAPEAAGCLERSSRAATWAGLATPEGGTVTRACLDAADADRVAVALPAVRGESILVHNHLWHRTGRNTSGSVRRALSILVPVGGHGGVRGDVRRRPREFERVFV